MQIKSMQIKVTKPKHLEKKNQKQVTMEGKNAQSTVYLFFVWYYFDKPFS